MNRFSSSRALPALLILGIVAVLVGGGLWQFTSRHAPAPRDAGASEVDRPPPAHAPERSGAMAQSSATTARQVVEVAFSGALAGAETISQRWTDDPATSAQPRRLRLVRDADGRVLRLVEHFQLDAGGTHLVAVATDVMRADAVLVAVPAGQDAVALARRLQDAGFVTEPVRSPDAVVCLHLAEPTLDAVPAAIDAVTARLPDLVAEPDFIRFRTQTTPNDYRQGRLWGLEKIQAPTAWTAATGSSEVVVAVIDSGVQTTHPDLSANIWRNSGEVTGNGVDDDGNGFVDDLNGWNFGSNNAAVNDTDGHGTHVSGTIGAVGNNGTGVVGVNWDVRIMALRAGDDTFADSALLNALRYAVTMRQRGVRVVAVNMSLGGTGFSATFRQELINARQAGILTIAAAGNLDTEMPTADNDSVPVYPASYDVDGLIAVASSTQGDTLSSFSHYGATSVDLAAPGSGILSTYSGGGYEWLNGTSMAAPHVAGAVALLAAADPALTVLQIRARILDTVDRVPALNGKVVTGGRLNLRRALSPALVRPRVVLTTGGAGADVAALDRPGLTLALAATVQGEDGVIPAATLAWTMEEGPQAVAFSTTTGTSTTATFPAAGRYRVRVSATAGGLQERDEIVVSVGPDTASTATGLQGWWRFDDTGTSTADASGNSRTGTVSGAIRTNTAVFGTAMDFNGSSSRVGFNSPTLTQVSIAGWARASGPNSLTIFPRILHMREGLLFGGFDSSEAEMGNHNTLKFALDNNSPDSVWHTTPGTFLVGTWFHVAVAFDPTVANPEPVFYINGVRQTTYTQDSPAATPSVALGQGYIGDRGDGTRGWLGQLDEIRLYNRILGDAEVAWMAREVTVAALAGGTLTQGSTSDPFTVPLTFTAASTGLASPVLLNPTWTDVGGTTTFTSTGATSATAAFTAPGTHLVRFDATSSDGVHITRTISVDVAAGPVTREGYYTGTTSTGGIWTLLVRSDGTGTFFSSGSRGSFQRDFLVSESGTFAIDDRSGTPVTGRIFADGSISGTIGGSATFSGARTTAGLGAADPARDGIYSGWVVDSGVRAAAQVERGLVSIVLEESGQHRAAAGSIDSAGAFALAPAAGASYSGTAGNGRLDATVTLPGFAGARQLVLLRDGTDPARRLVNISVRGVVGTGDAVMIPGFVVEGGSLPVLVRGIGPGLVPYGVSSDVVLQHPRIILRLAQALVRDNTVWTTGGQTGEIVAANTLTQAFALNAAGVDSALTLPLAAQAYTVEVNGADGGTGVTLAEIYDARTSSGPDVGELVNISGRGLVGTGDNILIGGFVVAGDAPTLVLIRAAGPALTRFGVGGVLAQPRLRVVRAGAELATAASWSAGDTAVSIAEAATRMRAFSFPAGSEDSALLLFLPPGSYTAQVSGAGATTGIALLEIYRVEGM
jgi:subtilisin family serine protease